MPGIAPRLILFGPLILNALTEISQGV